MTLYDALTFVQGHEWTWLIPIYLLLKVIDISKIPWNPWASIRNAVSKFLIGDLAKKIDEIDEKLEQHIAESDERDLRKRRESILDFASAIAAGRNYSEEQFTQMLKECDEYEMYCKKKKFVNSVADVSMNLIKAVYKEHKANNSFLKSVYYIAPRTEDEDEGEAC